MDVAHVLTPEASAADGEADAQVVDLDEGSAGIKHEPPRTDASTRPCGRSRTTSAPAWRRGTASLRASTVPRTGTRWAGRPGRVVLRRSTPAEASRGRREACC